MSNLPRCIAQHAGFTKDDLESFRCFVSCQLNPFGDASDDMLCAMVRYISPDNEKDWGYDVFVLHATDYPTLTMWEIECVFSTHHELFKKKNLV